MPSTAPQSPDHSLVQPRSRSNPIFNRVSNPTWAQSKPNPFQLKPIHSNPMQTNPVQPNAAPNRVSSPVQAHSIPDPFQPSPIQSNPNRTNPAESSQVNSIAVPNPIRSRSCQPGPVQSIASRSPHHSLAQPRSKHNPSRQADRFH